MEPRRDMAERAGASPGKGQRYVCITRPRRFGKTVTAEMIAAYFGKGTDRSAVFDRKKRYVCKIEVLRERRRAI